MTTELSISEVRHKLLSRTKELEGVIRWLAELTAMLERSESQLKTAQDALAVSDAKLVDTTKQLAETVKDLALSNEKLRLQEKTQKAFINIAAHELSTPIQPIIVILELLRSSPDKGEYRLTEDNFEIIDRSVKRLLRLAQDILDVAKIEGHTFNIHKAPLDLSELVSLAVKDYQMIAKKSNTRLNYLDGKATIVSADRNKIFQVVSNLLDNAVKFSPNGIITINIDKDNQQGIVEVSDTGGGISEDVLHEMFKKFAVKSEKGTGLGLYIAKTIVEAHGGSITGKNNVGKGATFRFTIPLETAQ